MGILVPLNDYARVGDLIGAGADEFYIGFSDEAWDWQVGSACGINRMSGFGPAANAYSFEEALDIINELTQWGLRVFTVLNAQVYSRTALAFQERYFEPLAMAGTSGVIVSMPQQVGMVRKAGLDAVASTMAGIYNSISAKWWADLGASRIILPRDLTLMEISQITRSLPDVEFEAFLMRNGCVFSDCYCLGTHGGPFGATCAEVKGAWKTPLGPAAPPIDVLEHNSDLYCNHFHCFACGLCALWRLEQAGITSYKIVGRSDETQALCDDIWLAAQNLSIAQDCASEQEYLERMVEHPYKEQVCPNGLNCYYPEVRFGDLQCK